MKLTDKAQGLGPVEGEGLRILNPGVPEVTA
jgi:hypothetical protein